MTTICPICKSKLKSESKSYHNVDAEQISCERCGIYSVDGLLLHSLASILGDVTKDSLLFVGIRMAQKKPLKT